jgi:hypothetical protein
MDDEASSATWGKLAILIFIIGSIILLLIFLTISIIIPMVND